MTSTWPDTDSGELIGGGRYRLGEVIGSGGMATVHRGHDLLLDRDVAVKVFREDIAEASDSRRVEAEMKLLGSINHPGLVTLHDAALSDDGSTAFLVMELVEGEHLAALLARGELSPSDVTAVVAQVAGALAHIHAKGIVHRDVKPANILVRRDDEGAVHAKLADLGIARMADATHLTTAGTILGTVAYLSPEQVTGGAIGPAADVYALGLVFLEALTGERRFTGTPAEQAAARTVAAPTVPDSVPIELAPLAEAMTRLDPSTRISAADVESALIAGVPDTARTRAMPAFLDLEATAANPVPGDQASNPDATARIETSDFSAPSSSDDRTVELHGAPVPEPTVGVTPSDEVRVAGPGTAGHGTPTAATTSPTAAPPTAPTAATTAPTTAAGSPTGPVTSPTTGFAESSPQTVHHGDRRRRGPVAALVVIIVLIAAAIGVVLAMSLLRPDGPTPPPYPTVEGELGDLLGELQRSVQP